MEMIVDYYIAYPLGDLNLQLGNDLSKLKNLLVECGVKQQITIRPSELRLYCPACSNTTVKDGGPGLAVKFKNGAVKWNCHKCGCQRKYFDNLIGLYRVLTGESNTWVAMRAMFDIAFKPKGKTTKVFPINAEGFKSRLLDEVPPHKIHWAAKSAHITDEQRSVLLDYLGLAPF